MRGRSPSAPQFFSQVSMAKILLVDGNSLGYANHSGSKLQVGTFETQAIFGTLRTLRNLLTIYPQHQPMVLWDGRAQWRYDLYPDYKSNRTDPKRAADKGAYHSQRPFLQGALKTLGVVQMVNHQAEADDIAGKMVAGFEKRTDSDVVLVTGDQDWLQLISGTTMWLDPIRERVVKPANLIDFTGYQTTKAFLQGKALHGDTSDTIKGCGGIGKEGAPLFLAEHGSVEEFWEKCDKGTHVPTKRAHISLWKGEGRANFLRNMQLMDLRLGPPLDSAHTVLTRAPANLEQFRKLCEKLAFVSFLRDFDNFTKPFRSNYEPSSTREVA